MSRDATIGEIRRAYRLRARHVHPDRTGGDAAAMQALNEAWRVLGDPDRRRAYDRSLEREGIAEGGGAKNGPSPDVATAARARATAIGGAECGPAGTAPGGGRGDALALVPPALVVAAVLTGAVAVVMASAAARTAAALLGILGGAAFALAPVVAVRRDRRRRD